MLADGGLQPVRADQDVATGCPPISEVRRHPALVLLEADELGAHLHLVLAHALREYPVQCGSEDAQGQLQRLRGADVTTLVGRELQARDRRSRPGQLVEEVEVLERARNVVAEREARPNLGLAQVVGLLEDARVDPILP